MPRVSIVTPVRNGARTLAEAVDSVLKQTVTDWEMIVVDDGSEDDTIAQLRRFRDDRIRWFCQGKLGRSAARNRGLNESTGEYLLFLDADDWLLPNSFHDHLMFLSDNEQFGVSVSDGHFCTDDGHNIASFSTRRGEVASGDVLSRIVLDTGLIGASLSAMIRRAIVRDFGLLFDTRLDFGEDWRFWVEAARFTSFGFFDAVTCKYRWHPGNTTLSLKDDIRRRQIWRSRKTVLEADFFSDLPLQVREGFFFQALVRLLAGQFDEQLDLLGSSRFLEMSPKVQARLLRLMAADYLLEREDLEAAQECLLRASKLRPFAIKEGVLRVLFGINPRLARSAIRIWRGEQSSPADPLFDPSCTTRTT